MSFSDHNSSSVRRRRRQCCRRFRKLFIFSSSPEPLGQFQPNLVQSIPWVKRIQDCSNKGPHPFPKGYNLRKRENIMTKF